MALCSSTFKVLKKSSEVQISVDVFEDEIVIQTESIIAEGHNIRSSYEETNTGMQYHIFKCADDMQFREPQYYPTCKQW